MAHSLPLAGHFVCRKRQSLWYALPYTILDIKRFWLLTQFIRFVCIVACFDRLLQGSFLDWRSPKETKGKLHSLPG
jgi:hypothetical protein